MRVAMDRWILFRLAPDFTRWLARKGQGLEERIAGKIPSALSNRMHPVSPYVPELSGSRRH